MSKREETEQISQRLQSLTKGKVSENWTIEEINLLKRYGELVLETIIEEREKDLNLLKRIQEDQRKNKLLPNLPKL